MNPEFVSDLVEDLIPESAAFRDAIRRRTSEIATRLAADVPTIAETLRNVGGKCMAFPAVWFTATALDLDVRIVDQAWPQFCRSVLVSLSTSLVDDVLDQDTTSESDCIAAAYILILESFNGDGAARMHERLQIDLMPVLPSFIGVPAEPTDAFNSLDRIGAFYRAISSEMCAALATSTTNSNNLAAACRQFGCWLCALDDVIDAARDIDAGRPASAAAARLGSGRPSMVWASWLQHRLDEIIAEALAQRWHRLIAPLESIHPRIPEIASFAEQELLGLRRELRDTRETS